MSLVAAARGGAKQATAVIGGAFVAAGKASALPGLVVFDGVGPLSRAAAGSGAPAYLVGVRPFSRAGRAPVSSAYPQWPCAYPRAFVGDARLAVVGRRVMPPHRLVQSRLYSGNPGDDPKDLRQFIKTFFKAVRAWICKILSSGAGNNMLNSMREFMDGDALRAWVLKVAKDLVKSTMKFHVGTVEAATALICKVEDCGKEFLKSVMKFVVSNLAAADAWVLKVEDGGRGILKSAKDFLVRIWLSLKSFLEGKSIDGGYPAPSPPAGLRALLKGVWTKVHDIDKTVQAPAAKTSIHEMLEWVLEERVAAALYKFVYKVFVTLEELYSIAWRGFICYCGVKSYRELHLTPMSAFRLFMNWLSSVCKENLAYIGHFKDPVDKASETVLPQRERASGSPQR